MKKILFLAILALILLLEYSCRPQSKGFALPKGDIENGKVAFFELGCNHCHYAGEIEWIGNPEDIRIRLGGPTHEVKTYGELVSSIINPSHKIAPRFRDTVTDESGDSKMRMYNEVMTVQDLVDIVTFLQEAYEITPPSENYYVYELK